MPRQKASVAPVTEKVSSTKKILLSFVALLDLIEQEGADFQISDDYLFSLLEIPYGLWPIWLYEPSHESLHSRKERLMQVLETIA